MTLFAHKTLNDNLRGVWCVYLMKKKQSALQTKKILHTAHRTPHIEAQRITNKRLKFSMELTDRIIIAGKKPLNHVQIFGDCTRAIHIIINYI